MIAKSSMPRRSFTRRQYRQTGTDDQRLHVLCTTISAVGGERERPMASSPVWFREFVT